MARTSTPKLNSRQEAAIDAAMSGLSNAAAARAAGYSSSSANQGMVFRSENVQRVLDEARAALARATNIRKKDVIMGVLDAIDRARLAGEPATEINGWKEVAKLLGYYAPEVKKIDLTINQGRLKSKFEQMTDEELYELAERPAIEGDFEVQ